MTILEALQAGLITEQYYFNLLAAGIQDYIQGGNQGVPTCNPSHRVSSIAQGPGICCAAFAASGQVAQVGARVTATNVKGQCIVCEIKSSTSKKHPGKLVFKRGQSSKAGSGVSCPTTAGGCCQVAGM